MRERLGELAEATGQDERADSYGSGERIARLEQQVAELLGRRPRSSCRQGRWRSRSHCGSGATAGGRVPSPSIRPATSSCTSTRATSCFTACTGGSSAIRTGCSTIDRSGVDPRAGGGALRRAPRRSLGGLLPESDDLVVQVAWARDRGVALHLDGARLSKAAPFYERSHAELAALFDSVARRLQGSRRVAGAALAGDETSSPRRTRLAAPPRRQRCDPAFVRRLRGAGARRARRPRTGLSSARGRSRPLPGPWTGRRRTRPAADTAVPHPPARRARPPGRRCALRRGGAAGVPFADPGPTTSPSWQRHEVMVGEVSLLLPSRTRSGISSEIIVRAAGAG